MFGEIVYLCKRCKFSIVFHDI